MSCHDFRNKTVLVTGAVRNTGLAIAEAFARQGAVVVLNGRNPQDVQREAKRLSDVHGVRVVEGCADITVSEAVDDMFDMIDSEFGRLDVLVNNAIVQGLGYSFVDTPLEFLEGILRTNVVGTFHCSQRAASMMIRAGHGSIVNIGSNTFMRVIRNRSAYVASKGAIDSLTRAMAIELGPQGVRVNSVVAGYIHSDRWADLPDADAQRRRKNVPTGHEATGSAIADAVLYLASDAASAVNGASLVADGGVSAQLLPPDCDV